MDQRANFLSLILLDALEDENESDVMMILERNCADASFVPLERGISPLHYVCGMENATMGLEIAKHFLAAGGLDLDKLFIDIIFYCIVSFIKHLANPNVASEDNMTPLHVAAIHGRLEIVKLLLEHGAKIDIRDVERKTPVHYAIEQCHFEVFQAMRDHIFLGKYEQKRQRAIVNEEPEGLLSTEQLNKMCLKTRHRDTSPVEANLEERVCVNKNLLSVTEPAENTQLTPNRVHYNYDTTSPYYINITHRRHKMQPLFPPINTPEPPQDTSTNNKTNSVQFSSPNKNHHKNGNDNSNKDNSVPVNIFSLTKENLEELSHTLPAAESSRLSLIEVWRQKVQKSRERKSILKEFNSVDELVDGVMQSDHLNFGNTLIRERSVEGEKKAANETDSGACDSPAPSRPDTVDSSATKIIPKRSNFEFSRLIKEISAAHVVGAEPPTADELESSYQTVPELVVNGYDSKSPDQNAKQEMRNSLNNTNFIRSPKNTDYFLQLAEAYVHTDDENGLVFYETKYPINTGNVVAQQRSPKSDIEGPKIACNNIQETTTTTLSTNITLPTNYETDALRAELTTFGDPPGPITKSTKQLYIKRLVKYKRKAPLLPETQQTDENCVNKFSVELHRTVRSFNFFEKIVDYLQFEAQSAAYFANHQNKRQMREGHLKQSFIYMLIDPRISCNLPGESIFLDKFDIWKRFLNSIFYVGKGKTSRPYSHLYEAMKAYSRMHHQQVEAGNSKKSSVRKQAVNVDLFRAPPKKSLHSKKLNRILEIWGSGKGVVCLHVFHNILPSEAYTREAAIIDALSLQHLTNIKRGDYYGIAKTWTMKKKKYLGIALLLRAMQIYLAEGESQLSPSDLI